MFSKKTPAGFFPPQSEMEENAGSMELKLNTNFLQIVQSDPMGVPPTLMRDRP